MTLILRPFILIATLASLMGCGRGPAREDLVDGQVVHYNSTDRADLIADEAEALLQPYALGKARTKFKDSLAVDPKNERARFWVALIDVFHELQGVLTRVKPAYLKGPNGEERYRKLVTDAERNYSTEHFNFLKTPRKDFIYSPAELAEWMDRFRLRIANLRSTLRDIRDSEFTITVPAKFLGPVFGKTPNQKCTPIAFGPVRYMPIGDLCATEGRNVFGLARADLELMNTLFSGMQLFLDLWTSYRINPEAAIGWMGQPIKGRADAETFTKSLFNGKNDGSLLRPTPFATLSEMGPDFLAALQYQRSHQTELCPLGHENPKNRRGYLVAMGACITVSMKDSEYDRTINGLEATIAGHPFEMEEKGPIQYNALINDPPKNLNAFFPLRFDTCGNLLGINTEPLKSMMTDDRLKTLNETEASCAGDHP